MTRAYQWQMRQKALGNCIWCGKPADGFVRCAEHREWFRNYAKRFRLKNLHRSRELERAKARKAFEKDPDKYRAKRRDHYALNKDRMRDYANAQRGKHPEKFRERDKARRSRVYQRRKSRWHSDAIYKIGMQLRHSLYQGLRRQSVSKTSSVVKLLGCSIKDFVIYIESKFDVGMNWQNWGNGEGRWHLDHIVPVSIFDLSKRSHQERCFHFSNYQPLWASDNLKKNAKPPYNHQFDIL